MKALLIGLGEAQPLFFLLDAAHQIFSLFVLAGHDIRNAQVGEHDGRHLQEVVLEALDNGIVVSTST